MAFIFRCEERAKADAAMFMPETPHSGRRLWQNAAFLACMVCFLIFSDWFNPGNAVVRRTDGTAVRGVVLQEMHDEVMIQVQESGNGVRAGDRLVLNKTQIASIEEVQSWVMEIFHIRWYLAGACGLAVLFMSRYWFMPSEIREWMHNTWDFAKILVPLLFGGVFLVGFIGALLPDEQIGRLVGDNSLFSNFFASIVGALFYFATLTEVPITQALMEHGMARGPVIALLLAGPALSLPNMIVLWKLMGGRKTVTFTCLIVVFSTVAGYAFGHLG
jgi:uncharacterized membrane protein YraQ (UPF0718 family)